MSGAGTPASDPWVIQPRERQWYEEQFKSLGPKNGIVTGEQAKGFLLQSQLPPPVLGQIWALSDTDADGKMDINEFSIACKLIHLKLRGTEIPKALPHSLITSLKAGSNTSSPMGVQPLIGGPPRPQPPKADVLSQSPLVQTAAVLPQQPLVNSNVNLLSQVPPARPVMPQVPMAAPLVQPTGVAQPIVNSMPPTGIIQPLPQMMHTTQPPLVSGLVNTAQPAVGQTFPITNTQPLIGTAPLVQSAPIIPPVGGVPVIPPVGTVPPVVPGIPPVAAVAPVIAGVGSTHATPRASVSSLSGMSPAGSHPPSLPGSVVHSAAPSIASSTPRASIDKGLSDLTNSEWAVPHQTKLKYTQLFNTQDRARTGFLSGVQARNIMVQSKLPQNILAQIWALSDMDADGQLSCEEFVLAMHLCEQATQGVMPPAVLPPDMIPPIFRRAPRAGSVSSQGSIPQEAEHAPLHHQNSFEDKRKENFEKGQAELERRRKTLLEAQRKEAEERERKEREENERKEKARQEAERKRLMELEQQLREQQEQERLKEEQRKREAEQKEAARKEMERQRQLEWEKQRSDELQQQRQREQEAVLKLKAKNQSLSIELSSLNDQVKELSQKICDTRVGVSNIKTTIDGMRTTRDSQMQEMTQLKNKLKEQNARLLALSHEKAKMEAKNKQNAQFGENDQKAFENKEIKIKQLKDKLEDLQQQINSKMTDIENNNSQLSDLKQQLASLVSECESLYLVYEQKKNTVLEMKGSRTTDYNSAWKDTNSWDTGATSEEWPVSSDNWSSSAATTETVPGGSVRYRALYEFVARNQDEISFQPGDIIMVPLEQKGEPGWLAGEIRGHTGWFPESYVEPVDSAPNDAFAAAENALPAEDTEAKRLELIAEVPENTSDTSSVDPTLNQQIASVEPVVEKTEIPVAEAVPEPTSDESVEYYVASYPYQSQEPGDLSFNAGDMIVVVKKEGDWWTGKIGTNVGIFPSNYVTKAETNNTTTTTTTTTNNIMNDQSILQAQQDSGTDNEVCQINDTKAQLEQNIDFAAMSANTQTLKSGKKPEIASVIAPYQATSAEQLSLSRGQLIMIRKKTDSGWWEGELQAKGKKRQIGWFPASYVKIMSSSGRISGRSTPVSTTRMQQEVILDKVIALFPYTANNPDELNFVKDDIISVTARDDPSWWRGELNGVSGLFPSNYVGPLQSYDPQEKLRQDCINELISTERAYVEDMTIVHNIFEMPLRMSKAISEEEVEIIFVNWQEIIQCNRRFLGDLLDRQDTGNYVIGDVICHHLPLMTGYIKFCSNQLDAASLLQRLTETSTTFRDFVKKCQSYPATKGLPLSSFLIKPMQRITKYPLLISKILENTSTNHPDFYNMKEALKCADTLCKQVNEGVRLKENSEHLDWLQNHVNCDDLRIKFKSHTNCLGPRKLLHYGMLQKLKSGKELIGFLLNDFLLLVQCNKPIGSKFTFQQNSNCSYKMYKQPIFVHEISISRDTTEHIDNSTDVNRVLRISDNNVNIIVLAPTFNESNLWMKRVEDAKLAFNNTKSMSNKPKTKNIGAGACGRLLVHVQKGKRIIKAARCMNPYTPALILTISEFKGYDIFNKKRKTLSLKRGKPYTENVFCKVQMGDQEQCTDVAKDNPVNGNVMQNGVMQMPVLVWNFSMQFHIKNINQDNLVITVYEKCLFAPDEFLGRAELKIQDIIARTRNTNGPILKRLILHQVENGEVEVKLDLQMFNT